MDKQYAGLKELAEERRRKLDHSYHHFLLCREVEDLEHWIAERDVVASSQEMGQDLDHVTVSQYTRTGLYSHTLRLLSPTFLSSPFSFSGISLESLHGRREWWDRSEWTWSTRR